jgi:hypothetical protein
LPQYLWIRGTGGGVNGDAVERGGNAAREMPVKQLIVQRCDTEGIAQCSMSTATPDASVCHHQATTCSVLPWQLLVLGQHWTKQRWNNAPTLLAILMAVAVCQ